VLACVVNTADAGKMDGGGLRGVAMFAKGFGTQYDVCKVCKGFAITGSRGGSSKGGAGGVDFLVGGSVCT